MDLIPLVSTAVGGALALGGAVVADVVRSRDTRARDDLAARKAAYLDFTLALGAGLQNLREVAGAGRSGAERPPSTPESTAVDLRAATSRALSDAGVYPARERLLMTAPPSVLGVAERAFDQLVEVRDAVRGGAGAQSAAYHDAYHPYAEQLWRLRNAIRADLGGRRLAPSDLTRAEWESRDACATCVGVQDDAVGKP